MSFARNFALGQQIAKTAMDVYEDARQKKEFADIQNAKPEYMDGYTAQDGEQLRAIANAKDADGNAYYNVEARPDGSYGVRSNFQVQGDNGQMATPGMVGVQPRNAANFLGQRYDAEQLTPDRMEALRARAMAGVISKSDPIRGLGLMQSIKQGERDDTRFGWEKDAQPLKQRAAELQVAGAERTERQGVRSDDVQSFEDAAMRMPENEVRSALTEYLNTNKSDLPVIVMGQTKGGMMIAERNPKTGDLGKPFEVPLSVGRKLVVGRQLADKGMGKEALTYLAGVDDNLNTIIDRYNTQQLKVAQVNNDAHYKEGSLANDAAKVGIARQHLNKPQWITLGDAEGNAHMVNANALPSKDGVAVLPPGMRMGKIPATLNDAQLAGLKAAHTELAQLPANAPQSAVDAVYAKYRLDPKMVGGSGGLEATGRFGGGAAGATPAPAKTAGLQVSPREQRRQELYDAWQNSKGPWYLPTPSANSSATAAERAYEDFLANEYYK